MSYWSLKQQFPHSTSPHTLSKSSEPLHMGSESALGVACSPQASILLSHDLRCKSRHTHTNTSEPHIRCHVAVNLPEAACNTTYPYLQKPILPLPLGSRCPSCRLKTNRKHSQPKDGGWGAESVSLWPLLTEICSKSTASQEVQEEARINYLQNSICLLMSCSQISFCLHCNLETTSTGCYLSNVNSAVVISDAVILRPQ